MTCERGRENVTLLIIPSRTFMRMELRVGSVLALIQALQINDATVPLLAWIV